MGFPDPLNTSPLPIAAYGLLADGHSAALVGTDGSVDWWCRPRFDSPAVFCRLLDHERGGRCRVGPVGRFGTSRRYVGPTAVLETTFDAAGGSMQVTDLLVPPRITAGPVGSTLLRLVEGLAGEVEIEIRFDPTFDYARVATRVEPTAGGAVATGGADPLTLVAPVGFSHSDRGTRGTTTVRAGDRFWVTVGEPVEGPRVRGGDDLLARTLAEQQRWASTGTYDGPYADLVQRSAITLSLLTYTPTGAPVAAPTTSLPEDLGGVRNWDYRYTWLRDATLGLAALQRIGHHDEAMAFWEWIAARSAEADGEGLQIAYRVDGDVDLAEESLAHLSGYAGSRPVRIGNAAAEQRQHDVTGEVLDAALYCWEHMPGVDHPFQAMRRLADDVCRAWREPDRGIWEVRSEPRHFLHSKLFAWVGLDRAARLAEAGGTDGDTAAGRRERDEIARAIVRDGVDPATGAFTQSFWSADLDATALAVPLVGFVPPDDPRVTATIRGLRERLEDGGLLYRYLDDDGLPGREGAFVPCTFWLAEALALRGELDAAHDVFERAAGCANDLGLLPEEADPASGEALGNFPQAFSHLALMRAADRLATT